MSTDQQIAEAVLQGVGGPGNIASLTHCATRLRFELVDASKVDADALERSEGVLGVVPQSGGRYQVVIGGAVAGVYNAMQQLPAMRAGAVLTDAEVKAQARSKARGRFAWLDNFFEYLSDSFRPILGVLLGASLIIAFAAVLDALELVDFRAADKAASWVFVDALWRAVFYFLPIMVAYNAAKKLEIDPWLGATVMGALLTPEFLSLSKAERFPDLACTTNELLGTQDCTARIFGLPLQLNEYGGNVFVPLIMVAVLALVYKGLKRIIPENLQMVFVPFISMAVMIPVTAFLIGPMGVWLGNGLGAGLAWMNAHAPFVFALIIPMVYPFLVPLGLHWPLNALMLVNIQTLGYDFIQGPMGAWNFACFGATAGVLFLSMRDRDVQMRQTATGALAAGLLGGISEPSLYGIHLRFKRIYPLMLIGCFAGGLTIAILGLPSGGVTTGAFAFTSLLTIPVFDPMWVYAIAIGVAFFTAFALVAIFDYRTAEQKACADAPSTSAPATAPLAEDEGGAGAPEEDEPLEPTTAALAPVPGRVISLAESGDKVFASGALGAGVAILPSSGTIVAPVSGVLATVAKTGHAFGIKTADGVELLVHVGIDTVQMDGDGFDVKVVKKQEVFAGEVLVEVDLAKIEQAGYATTTLMTVTNTKAMRAVTPLVGSTVEACAPVIDIQR
ncbi:glucose PTS transporter subunit IIA [Schaalia hyovaginalis]|uniref:glucose PTS transporter subunit IIA n=1 Tax=Schaalia hyovaginalis TaxID=29316 RepID=UPI0026EBDCBD|nr:glucose PTS transporter subunit IIA [Schaalia hyovaginalis]MCI6557985.1 glucose PTS transporter subunit IIA [Schaalia hyovaginalis]MDD7553414.1 glucose PTS transporter subunit IIA [Schaalia hyovaginalis]MDY3094135.1 glucose PTS transporter subunit IIA [Schaalia hyovaginalis]